jgi:hypothetical protein
MKDGSCTFFPGCPPCFGLCDTEHAPYDMEDNKSCDGCETCKEEKAKGKILPEINRVDAVFTQLFKDGKIKEEAISILYVERIISRNAFHAMKNEAKMKNKAKSNYPSGHSCCLA